MSKDQFIKCCKSFLRFIILNPIYLLDEITKIIIQIFEFYTIIILTNIILGYNIIFSSAIVENKTCKIIFSFIFNVIFSYISSNFLTIYYYELCQLSWIKYDIISDSMEPDIYIPKNKSNEDLNIFNSSNDESNKLINKGSNKSYKYLKEIKKDKAVTLKYKSLIILLMVLLYIFDKGDIYDFFYVILKIKV